MKSHSCIPGFLIKLGFCSFLRALVFRGKGIFRTNPHEPMKKNHVFVFLFLLRAIMDKEDKGRIQGTHTIILI